MKTKAIAKHGHHGGRMTPRAPKTVAPMQEFTCYVVVDAKGNADPLTLSRSKAGATRMYMGVDMPLSRKAERNVLREMQAHGDRIARVAVAEDA